jgi:hypothetical protein
MSKITMIFMLFLGLQSILLGYGILAGAPRKSIVKFAIAELIFYIGFVWSFSL